jgi:hypothetical protein
MQETAEEDQSIVRDGVDPFAIPLASRLDKLGAAIAAEESAGGGRLRDCSQWAGEVWDGDAAESDEVEERVDSE